MMAARAGESILSASECQVGISYSVKEYEDIAITFARDKKKLQIWRRNIEKSRSVVGLFDTRSRTKVFENLLLTTYESNERKILRPYHIFSTITLRPTEVIQLNDVDEEGIEQPVGPTTNKTDNNLREILQREHIFLNIGGIHHAAGWVNINSQQGVGVDLIRNMHDLYGFPDASVSVIYSSHTLEHGTSNRCI